MKVIHGARNYNLVPSLGFVHYASIIRALKWIFFPERRVIIFFCAPFRRKIFLATEWLFLQVTSLPLQRHIQEFTQFRLLDDNL